MVVEGLLAPGKRLSSSNSLSAGGAAPLEEGVVEAILSSASIDLGMGTGALLELVLRRLVGCLDMQSVSADAFNRQRCHDYLRGTKSITTKIRAAPAKRKAGAKASLPTSGDVIRISPPHYSAPSFLHKMIPIASHISISMEPDMSHRSCPRLQYIKHCASDSVLKSP